MTKEKRRALLLIIGIGISTIIMFGQELPKLKVTERDMSGIIFRNVGDDESVVEIQSNVRLEFESTMDSMVNVYKTYEESGFFFYELLFPTNPKNIPTKYNGRKLKIKSFGYETYTQLLDLKAKVPLGLLVMSETKLQAEEYYNAGKFSEALKEYEKLYSINSEDEYVKHRIKICNDRINRNKITVEDNSPKLIFLFKGENIKQNPSVKLYLDNQLIGEGNLNKGFNIKSPDRSAKLDLLVDWSDYIIDKTFKIDTHKQKVFEFKCKIDGFGRHYFSLEK